jgi:hypothetical protein
MRGSTGGKEWWARHRVVLSAVICFACFLVFYGVTARGDLQTSDESAVFATGIALATLDRLSINELAWMNENVNLGKKGPDGNLYAKYFPGNIFGVALVYKLAARPYHEPYFWVRNIRLADSGPAARLAMRLNALWGALAMTSLLLLVRRYFDWRTAILTVLLVGLCSNWWYESRGLFSEAGAASFLITSLCLSAYGRPYASTTALALSLLFRPTNVIGFPIWVKTVWGKWGQAFATGLTLVAAVFVLAFFNWIRFGSPLDFGYGQETFQGSILRGLHGLFLTPGRSLFVYSPVLLLAIPGTWLIYKKERALVITCLIVIVSYILAIATWWGWDGGLAWGCRLLTPIVPLLGFLTAPVLFHAWKNRWVVTAVAVLALTGFSVQVIALLRNPLRVMIERVASGEVSYDDTFYTVRKSWMALQIGALTRWEPCDLDSYTLRRWFTQCPK